MFEFLRNGPLGRLKFVQRMLDRSDSSRPRRRLSAGADDDDVSETEAEVDASHRGGRLSGDPESLSIDCTERRVADPPAGGELSVDGRNAKVEALAARASAVASATPRNEEVAARESAQTVAQRATAALSAARVTAQVDIPLHARARYSIECDIKSGTSVPSKEATAHAAAPAEAAPVRRRSSWHSSLRQSKAKSALQLSKLRISFRKKPSTSQADYNVLADDGHHFDVSETATASEAASAERPRRPEGQGDASAHSSDATSTVASTAEELPKSSQAVAEALRRSFRKTSKYFHYGAQSVTITKPATSLNWAASSSTKQTLI